MIDPRPTCPRCDVALGDKPEACWYCLVDICVACWNAHGHCGHLEAKIINEIGKAGGARGYSLGGLKAMTAPELQVLLDSCHARNRSSAL